MTTHPVTAISRNLRLACLARLLPFLLMLVALPATVQALDYTYTTSGGAVTITGYTGPGGVVSIPGSIDGLPVTGIGDFAFSGCIGLTGVNIPGSVTGIGSDAFYDCGGLTSASFTGNAPVMGSSVFNSTASGFAVYNPGTSTGFTSPTWNGYPAVSVGGGTAPVATTAAASGITVTSATLNGTVNPNGATTTARFEYGPTTGYGSTAMVTLTPANGTTIQTVSANISSLQAGQTYHYRLTATNSGGTSTGADMTLTTVMQPLVAGELAAPKIAISGGNLNFTVQPSVAGRTYQLQSSDTMAAGTWQNLGAQRVGDGANLVISTPYVPAVARRFYRIALVGVVPF